MEISKTVLQNALEVVKPGLASKELIEQSTSFAFIGGRVVTYNDEISISHPIEGLDLEGAIMADHLYKFLSKVKMEELAFEVQGNELILVTGRAKVGLTLQAEVKLPLDEEVSQKGKWKPIPANLISALKFAMSSCTRDMSQPVLTCVHASKDGIVEASDGYKIAQYNINEELPIEGFLLPGTSTEQVVKLNPTKIAEGQGWVHFKTDRGTIISCRLFEADEYPPIDNLLHVKGTRVVLPKTISGVLERAMVFAKREHLLDENISIIIQKQVLTMTASSDGGWFKEEVNTKYDGEPLSIQITPYLLKGILSETQVCEVTKAKIKFAGENWVYVSSLRTVKPKS